MGNNAEAKYRVTATDSASKIFDHVRSSAGGMNKSFGAAAVSAKAFGVAIAAIGGGAIVQSLSATEKLRGSLKTATGSLQGATSAFKDLEKFASTTPFALEQSIEAFVQLKNLGLDPSMEALQSYGNTASAMGKDLSQFIEAVADASTNEFERLKEFGIKAKQQGDQVAFTFQGQTTIVRKSAVEIEGYLQGIGNNKFGEAMSDQMKLLPGAISNAEDAVSRLIRSVGDTGLTDAIASTFTYVGDTLNSLSDYVSSSSFVATLQGQLGVMQEQWGPVFNSIVGVVGGAYDKIAAMTEAFTSRITGGATSNLAKVFVDGFTTLPITAELAWVATTGLFEKGVISLQSYAGAIKINLVSGFQSAGLKIQEIWIEIKQGFAGVVDFVTSGLSKLSSDVQATNFAQGYEDQIKSIHREQLELGVATSESLSEMTGWYISENDAIHDNIEALQQQRDEILAGRDAKMESIKASLDLKASNDALYSAKNASSSSPDSPISSNVTPITPQFDLTNLQSQMQAISESLQSPVEAINAQFESQLFAVEESFQALAIGKQEHDRLIEGLEEQHQSKLADLRKSGLSELEKFQELSKKKQVSTLLGQMTQMTAGVAQGSRAMFEINKTASIAEGLLNLKESITSAYKYGSEAGGPVVGAAYAAVAGAAQLANLQAIRSTSFGGGGGGSAPSQAGDVPVVTSDSSYDPAASGVSTDSASSSQIIVVNNYGTDFMDNDAVDNATTESLKRATGDDKISWKNGQPIFNAA